MRKSSMSCIGRGLCRILSTWMVFGDTSEEDETYRKVYALFHLFPTMKKFFILIFLSVFCMNKINAVTCSLSDDGSTLIISGIGDMDDYTPYFYDSWHEHRDRLRTVIILDGVTSIGNYAFGG